MNLPETVLRIDRSITESPITAAEQDILNIVGFTATCVCPATLVQQSKFVRILLPHRETAVLRAFGRVVLWIQLIEIGARTQNRLKGHRFQFDEICIFFCEQLVDIKPVYDLGDVFWTHTLKLQQTKKLHIEKVFQIKKSSKKVHQLLYNGEVREPRVHYLVQINTQFHSLTHKNKQSIQNNQLA